MASVRFAWIGLITEAVPYEMYTEYMNATPEEKERYSLHRYLK